MRTLLHATTRVVPAATLDGFASVELEPQPQVERSDTSERYEDLDLIAQGGMGEVRRLRGLRNLLELERTMAPLHLGAYVHAEHLLERVPRPTGPRAASLRPAKQRDGVEVLARAHTG